MSGWSSAEREMPFDVVFVSLVELGDVWHPERARQVMNVNNMQCLTFMINGELC